MADHVASHQADASAPPSAGPAATPNAGRKNFTAADDLTLLRCVNSVRPWEAAVGTANGIMKAFDSVAEKCRAVEGFVKKDGPAIRTRFDRLVRVYRADERNSLRSSGTTEEYEERDVLLEDIVCRMDNWKEKTMQERATERAKIQGIETSGELMRRLAMDELRGEEERDGDTCAAGDGISVDAETAGHGSQRTGSPAGPQAVGAKDNVGRKRAAPVGSRRPTKPSKREKLSAVRDSIAQAIEHTLSDSSAKYEYLRERLHFEREEAARRIELEEKRLLHEREREERREAAEQRREEENQAFMVKLLQIAMGKNADK
ncbi:uncharacterized protein IUM83_18654 [Phytophthora cinnamomi]|uniref:uncharacterized protein n=1 Tax=Phytophthora cinnamomi TaxID=4785 RepID=UPI00355A8497|nr:hypothetical protein IUM83_18654 [Phytophthora cinnamomi]